MATAPAPHSIGSRLWRVVTWLIAFGCFYLVYGRAAAAAARDSITPLAHLIDFFNEVDWGASAPAANAP